MSSNTPNDPGKESDGSNGRRPNPNRNSNILKTEDMGIDPVEGGGDDGVTFDNLSDPTALLIFIKGQGIKIPRNGDPPTEDPRNTDYIDLENVQRAVDNMEASLNNVSNRQNPQSSAPVISSQRAVKRERQDSDKAQPEARASKKCRQDPEEAHQGAQAPDGEALRARHTGIQRSDCQYPNPMPYVNRPVQQGTGLRKCRPIMPNVRHRIEWGAADFGPGGFGPQAIPVNNLPPGMNNMSPEMDNASNMNTPMTQAPHHLRAYSMIDNGPWIPAAAQRNHPPPPHARPGPQNYGPNIVDLNFNFSPQPMPQMGPQIPPQVPIMNGEHMSYENMAHLPQVPRQVPPIPQMPSQVPDMNGWPVHHANLVHIPNTVGASQQPMMPMPQMGPQGHHMNRGQMHDTNMAYVPHAPPQWPPIPQMPGMNGNMHQTNLVYIPNTVGAPQQPMMPMPQIGPQMSAQVPGMNGEHMLQSNGMPRQMRPRHVRPGHTQSGQRPTGQRPLRQRPNGQSPPGQRPPRP
ncbi:hypothetical protein ACHAP4_000068 [Fusarium culmorum]